MSRTVQTAVMVIVVVVVVVGLWWFMSNQNVYAPSTATNIPPAPADVTADKPAPKIGATPGASIEQDMASIDAQLNALGSDSAAVDQSMSDTPVPQVNP